MHQRNLHAESTGYAETPASQRTSRRDFLAVSSATAGSLMLSSKAARGQTQKRLKLAFIGVGGRGGANLRTMARDPDVEVVALCDVNRRSLEAAHRQFPKARTYVDFRELYREADEIEGVVVSTCEHTHAFATMPALRMGKHVYCEKPLTHNVAEARAITAAAEEAGVATQMGTQIHAGKNYHRVVELIRSGAIGTVSEVHVWVGRAWGLQTEEEAKRYGDIVHVTERPTEKMQPPEHLEWDLWLGPAPYRPYHSVYFPGPKWYRWWDFGNGTMSDLGSHWVDLPYWALQLDAPTRVTPGGGQPHPEIAPASMTASYEYPARQAGQLPACTVTWYQGSYKPQLWESGEIPKWGSGVLFIGSDGMLLSDYGKHVLLPEAKFKDFEYPEPFIPDSPGQHQEWLLACREGTPTASPFGYAGPLTEANHLGNVAFRAGGPIDWDSPAMRVTNSASANEFIQRKPREGWTL